MLPIYFDYIFVHLRQKITSQAQNFCQLKARTRARPEKPGPTYNSDFVI